MLGEYNWSKTMKGAFTLQTPHDLLEKLESDYDALMQDRNNPYLAYNFFVTAEHMLDWVYPGYANKNKRLTTQSPTQTKDLQHKSQQKQRTYNTNPKIQKTATF